MFGLNILYFNNIYIISTGKHIYKYYIDHSENKHLLFPPSYMFNIVLGEMTDEYIAILFCLGL